MDKPQSTHINAYSPSYNATPTTDHEQPLISNSVSANICPQTDLSYNIPKSTKISLNFDQKCPQFPSQGTLHERDGHTSEMTEVASVMPPLNPHSTVNIDDYHLFDRRSLAAPTTCTGSADSVKKQRFNHYDDDIHQDISLNNSPYTQNNPFLFSSPPGSPRQAACEDNALIDRPSTLKPQYNTNDDILRYNSNHYNGQNDNNLMRQHSRYISDDPINRMKFGEPCSPTSRLSSFSPCSEFTSSIQQDNYEFWGSRANGNSPTDEGYHNDAIAQFNNNHLRHTPQHTPPGKYRHFEGAQQQQQQQQQYRRQHQKSHSAMSMLHFDSQSLHHDSLHVEPNEMLDGSTRVGDLAAALPPNTRLSFVQSSVSPLNERDMLHLDIQQGQVVFPSQSGGPNDHRSEAPGIQPNKPRKRGLRSADGNSNAHPVHPVSKSSQSYASETHAHQRPPIRFTRLSKLESEAPKSASAQSFPPNHPYQPGGRHDPSGQSLPITTGNHPLSDNNPPSRQSFKSTLLAQSKNTNVFPSLHARKPCDRDDITTAECIESPQPAAGIHAHRHHHHHHHPHIHAHQHQPMNINPNMMVNNDAVNVNPSMIMQGGQTAYPSQVGFGNRQIYPHLAPQSVPFPPFNGNRLPFSSCVQAMHVPLPHAYQAHTVRHKASLSDDDNDDDSDDSDDNDHRTTIPSFDEWETTFPESQRRSFGSSGPISGPLGVQSRLVPPLPSLSSSSSSSTIPSMKSSMPFMPLVDATSKLVLPPRPQHRATTDAGPSPALSHPSSPSPSSIPVSPSLSPSLRPQLPCGGDPELLPRVQQPLSPTSHRHQAALEQGSVISGRSLCIPSNPGSTGVFQSNNDSQNSLMVGPKAAALGGNDGGCGGVSGVSPSTKTSHAGTAGEGPIQTFQVIRRDVLEMPSSSSSSSCEKKNKARQHHKEYHQQWQSHISSGSYSVLASMVPSSSPLMGIPDLTQANAKDGWNNMPNGSRGRGKAYYPMLSHQHKQRQPHHLDNYHQHLMNGMPVPTAARQHGAMHPHIPSFAHQTVSLKDPIARCRSTTSNKMGLAKKNSIHKSSPFDQMVDDTSYSHQQRQRTRKARDTSRRRRPHGASAFRDGCPSKQDHYTLSYRQYRRLHWLIHHRRIRRFHCPPELKAKGVSSDQCLQGDSRQHLQQYSPSEVPSENTKMGDNTSAGGSPPPTTVAVAIASTAMACTTNHTIDAQTSVATMGDGDTNPITPSGDANNVAVSGAMLHADHDHDSDGVTPTTTQSMAGCSPVHTTGDPMARRTHNHVHYTPTPIHPLALLHAPPSIQSSQSSQQSGSLGPHGQSVINQHNDIAQLQTQGESTTPKPTPHQRRKRRSRSHLSPGPGLPPAQVDGEGCVTRSMIRTVLGPNGSPMVSSSPSMLSPITPPPGPVLAPAPVSRLPQSSLLTSSPFVQPVPPLKLPPPRPSKHHRRKTSRAYRPRGGLLSIEQLQLVSPKANTANTAHVVHPTTLNSGGNNPLITMNGCGSHDDNTPQHGVVDYMGIASRSRRRTVAYRRGRRHRSVDSEPEDGCSESDDDNDDGGSDVDDNDDDNPKISPSGTNANKVKKGETSGSRFNLSSEYIQHLTLQVAELVERIEVHQHNQKTIQDRRRRRRSVRRKCSSHKNGRWYYNERFGSDDESDSDHLLSLSSDLSDDITKVRIYKPRANIANFDKHGNAIAGYGLPMTTTIATISLASSSDGHHPSNGKLGKRREFHRSEVKLLSQCACVGLNHTSAHRPIRQILSDVFNTLTTSEEPVTESRIQRWFLAFNKKVKSYQDNPASAASSHDAMRNAVINVATQASKTPDELALVLARNRSFFV